MTENGFDPERHHRHQFRLREYDYTNVGAYFVTVCTKDKQLFFENESIKTIAQKCWEEIPQHFPNVELDQFVIMPNHVHGIIIITERRDVIYRLPTKNTFGPLKPGSLSAIIGSFKAACTRLIRRDTTCRVPTFAWQNRFYEHVIRNEKEMDRIRQYIIENPARWAEDEENPDRRIPAR
jgi:REP element-mobilizing transposase RayT